MPRRRISRVTFDKLYEAVSAKLSKEVPAIHILKPDGKQDTVQLGIKWVAPPAKQEHNASAVIHRALVVSKKIDALAPYNFGDMLYKKHLYLEKHVEKDTVVVEGDEAYLDGLPRYLGFSDLDDFEKSLLKNAESAQKNLKTANSPEPAPEKPPVAAEIPYTYYIGTYYSFRSYRVNKFVLAIQYTDTPTQPMRCWQWGFHVTERFEDSRRDARPEKVKSVRFDGTAEVRGSHLYINLIAPADTNQAAMEMHFIGICDEPGGVTLKDQESIPCAIQTIS